MEALRQVAFFAGVHRLFAWRSWQSNCSSSPAWLCPTAANRTVLHQPPIARTVLLSPTISHGQGGGCQSGVALRYGAIWNASGTGL